MFKNLKIRTKLIAGFLIVAAFVALASFYTNIVLNNYSDKKGILEEVKFSFESQKGSFLGFLNGNESAEALIKESGEFIAEQLDTLLPRATVAEKESLEKLKNISSRAFDRKFNHDDPESSVNLLEKQETAFRECVLCCNIQ